MTRGAVCGIAYRMLLRSVLFCCLHWFCYSHQFNPVIGCYTKTFVFCHIYCSKFWITDKYAEHGLGHSTFDYTVALMITGIPVLKRKVTVQA